LVNPADNARSRTRSTVRSHRRASGFCFLPVATADCLAISARSDSRRATNRRKVAGFITVAPLQLDARMQSKRTVYILKTVNPPIQYYTGLTSDVVTRLAAHNAGRVPHTSKCRPWALDVSITFADEARAIALERYLKSGSGAAFSTRHLR
jgi:putative endonuclease